MSDRLHDDLEHLAQQVTVVDLRDRALRTSRSRSRRKAIASSLTVLVLLAGAGFAAWTRVDRGPDSPPVGPTPTISPTPSVSPNPDPVPPTDFAFPPLDASATHLGPWTLKPAPFLPGQLFLFSHPYGDGEASISILAGGQLRTSSLGYLASTSCIANSYVFSPDGTHVAWVRGSLGVPGGQLVSTDLATRTSVVIANDVSCLGNQGPKWSTDSRSIIYNVVAEGYDDPRKTSLDTGQTIPLPGGQGAYQGVRTKNFRAYGAIDSNDIIVLDANDNYLRTARNPAGDFSSLVIGLSEDGRYVTLSPRISDPHRRDAGKTVLDTLTSTIATPSVPSDGNIQHSIGQILFLPTGRMLVQISRADGSQYLRLLAADRSVVSSIELEDRAALLQLYLP